MPGQFDPINLNHLDILERCLKIFDKVIVLVLNNKNKKTSISINNRLELIKIATNHLKNVETDYWEKNLVNYAEISGACAIVKIIKNYSNFVNEFDEFATNKFLNPVVETIFMPASPKYMHISSKLIKKLAFDEKNLDTVVSKTIVPALIKFLNEV